MNKLKKTLALLLSLVMILSLLPAVAFADGEELPAEQPDEVEEISELVEVEAQAEGNVAQIGDKEYATLADALTDAASGDKIVMVADASVSSATSLSKSITLDLKGHTITSTATLFNIYNGSVNLTITDSGETGAINVTADKGIYISSGKLTLEGGALTLNGTGSYNYVVSVGGSGTFEMTGGALEIAQVPTSSNWWQTYNAYGLNNSGTAMISGGRITASSNGANYAVSSNGTLNISGGHIEANNENNVGNAPYAVYVTGGSASITGGTIVIGDLDTAGWSEAHLVTGSTVVSGGTYIGKNIDISGVKGKLEEGYALRDNGDGSHTVVAGGKFAYWHNDGTTGGRGYYYYVKDEALTLPAYEYSREGYTFAGFNTEKDGSGTTVQPGATITFTGTGTVAFYAQWTAIPYVAQIGDVKYTTLAAAIADVPTDGTETTITMIGDETIVGNAGVTVAVGMNIVLDLNGHTIQNAVNENKASQVITNRGNLTIQDTSANADGEISNAIKEGTQPGEWWSTPQYNYASNVITNSGTLTVKSGTIRQTAAGSICYAVDNQSTSYDTTLNVEGGLLTDNYGTVVRMFCNSTTKNNTVNVSGGEIYTNGKAAIWTQLPGSTGQAKKGTLNITGGTVRGASYAWYDYTYGDVFDAMDYSISGGQFGGDVCSDGVYKFITGGIYVNAPTPGYIADGYVAVENTDEATKTAYPWAVVKVPVTVEETTTTGTTEEATAQIKQGDDVQATVTVTVADETTVQTVTNAVAASVPNVSTSLNVAKVVEKAAEEATLSGETNTIEILVKAEAATEVPNVTVPTGAKVVEVDPYAIVNNDTAHPIALTNDDLGSSPSFTFQVGGFTPNTYYTIKHYDKNGELKNTFNNVLTDASGNATVTLTSFSYLIGEVAYQVSSDTGNYLQTTNADIRSSLLWNVYFHIETSSIADPVNNAYILVSSRYDEEIDGQTYQLTFDSVRNAYMITVPIRPRLIDQEVGFTLISNGTVYPMTYGSAGANLYNELTYSFSNYLTSIESGEDASVVAGMRVWRDVLKARWPIVANY